MEDINNKKLYEIPDEIPVYLTFDIDCLSPEILNGTATPIFNGMRLQDVILIVKELFKNKNIVGFDIVEGNKKFDNTDITTQTALYLFINFLNLIKI